MKREGFEYASRPYISTGEPGSRNAKLKDFIEIEDAEWAGYYNVISWVMIQSIPTGEPPKDLSRTETQAYDVALLGKDFDVESGELGGCRREGHLAALKYGSGPETLDPALMVEFLGQLEAASEFARFESSWYECMSLEGISPEGSVLMQAQHYDEVVSDALNLILIRSEDIGEELSSAFGDAGSLELDEIVSAISQFPEVEVLLAQEIRIASTDKRCRSEHWDLLLPVLNTLSREIFDSSSYESL